MRKYWSKIAAILCCASLAGSVGRAAEPSFKEICTAIRTNLEGVTEQDLDHAALQGLLQHFAGRVSLVTNNLSETSQPTKPLLSRSAVYDDNYGYLRVGRVAAGLHDELLKAFNALSATNQLKGLVLDLRQAGGNDYPAAAEAAALFISKSNAVLLQWGGESARANPDSRKLSGPVMILVNRATSGAAEALAAVLRENKAGLLIGAQTAGKAAVSKEIKLSTGHLLWLAAAQVKTGGGQVLTGNGLKPDIAVALTDSEEEAYLKDPYATFSASGVADTNKTNRPRLTEADLVRLKREGFDIENGHDLRPLRPAEPAKPVIKDPVLARALDLLKALAVVQSSKWR